MIILSNESFGFKGIEAFKIPMRKQLTAFYFLFWHSEQRYLYHLLHDQNDDINAGANELSIHNQRRIFRDNLSADEKITSVLIPLHSY